MKYSTRIKSISYLKANAAEILRELAEQREPLVITQNGAETQAGVLTRRHGLLRLIILSVPSAPPW